MYCISNAPLWRYLQGKGDQWISWRISLRAGNGTEVVMETQVVSTRTPASYSHSAGRQTRRGWLPKASFLPASSRPPCPGMVWRQWPERNVGKPGTQQSVGPRRLRHGLVTQRQQQQNAISHFLYKVLGCRDPGTLTEPLGTNNRVSKVVEIVFLAHPAI